MKKKDTSDNYWNYSTTHKLSLDDLKYTLRKRRQPRMRHWKISSKQIWRKAPDFSHWILVLSCVLSAVTCGLCISSASETNSTYTWKPTTSEITKVNTPAQLLSEEHDKCRLIWNCISLLPFLGNPCCLNLWTPKGTKSSVFTYGILTFS